MPVKLSKRMREAILEHGLKSDQMQTMMQDDVIKMIAMISLDEGQEILIPYNQWERLEEDVVLSIREGSSGEWIVKREINNAQKEAEV